MKLFKIKTILSTLMSAAAFTATVSHAADNPFNKPIKVPM
jgi:hypothetical protein